MPLPPSLLFFFFFFSLFLCLILAFSTLQLQFPVRSTFRVHEREHGQVRGPLVLVILVMIRLMFQKLALGSDHIGILDRVLQTSRICKFAYMSMPMLYILYFIFIYIYLFIFIFIFFFIQHLPSMIPSVQAWVESPETLLLSLLFGEQRGDV